MDCGTAVTSTCYGLFVPEGIATTVASGTKTNFSNTTVNKYYEMNHHQRFLKG